MLGCVSTCIACVAAAAWSGSQSPFLVAWSDSDTSMCFGVPECKTPFDKEDWCVLV